MCLWPIYKIFQKKKKKKEICFDTVYLWIPQCQCLIDVRSNNKAKFHKIEFKIGVKNVNVDIQYTCMISKTIFANNC